MVMGSVAALYRHSACAVTVAVALAAMTCGCDLAESREKTASVPDVPASSIDGGRGSVMQAPPSWGTFRSDAALDLPNTTHDGCENPRLPAASLEATLGGPVRFIGFFDDGIVAELADGENVLVHFPSVEIARLPPDARALKIRSSTGLYVLGCSMNECALLEPDPTRSGFLRRVRGGTVPVPGDFRYLYPDGFRLCVSNDARVTLCFDRVQWDALDGGVLPSLGDAGASDTHARDAGTRDAAVLPTLDPGPAPCAAPIYCDDPSLGADPLCYYSFEESSHYLEGVTVAGRMVTASYTGTGTALCSASPAYGAPVGLASSGCGLSRHVVMLTADGLFETCGCILD